MHDDILKEIYRKTSMPGMPPIEMTFENHQYSGHYQQSFEKKCTLSQLKEVLRNYNVFPQDIDLKFLATQYIVSGRQDEIHYQKLIDDIKGA